MLDDFGGQLPGILFRHLGSDHGQIGGQIAVDLVLGPIDLDGRREIGGQQRLGPEGGQGVVEQRLNLFFHGFIPLMKQPFTFYEKRE